MTSLVSVPSVSSVLSVVSVLFLHAISLIPGILSEPRKEGQDRLPPGDATAQKGELEHVEPDPLVALENHSDETKKQKRGKGELA